MEYITKENNIIVNGINDFDIEHILECGQCFRFYKNDEKDYTVVAHGRIVRLTQNNGRIILYGIDAKDFKNIWIDYFDMNRDYGEIKKILSKGDTHLNKAIQDKNGIRILKQQTWETLISFIISSNKQIPHIKKLIENISKRYGEYIGEYKGNKVYAFPTVNQLINASEEDLRVLKVGFRAPYIRDACIKVSNGEVELDKLQNMELNLAKQTLMKIKGVGNKVADCVLLYGVAKYEVFPTDVWVKRIMEYYYFDEHTKLDDIQQFANATFKELAGFAQQYLFYHARDKKIGK